MSTPPPPPERPTEPLRRPRPAPVVEERVAPAAVPVADERLVAPAVDPNVILLRLEAAIESLRTWLVVVGLVAVAALGVALYAILGDDDGGGGSGSTSGLASDERASRLDNRIDRLSRQVQDLRSGDAGGDESAALAGRVDSLESTVKSLSGQPAASGTQDAIDELSKRIDDLSGRVEQLQQAQP